MTKPSWLFWVVAVLALLWNGFGIFDYWMTSTGNEKYLQDFDPQMIEWILGFPLWRNILWILSVATGALGAIALVLRKKVAVRLFLINIATLLVGFVGHDILMADGVEMYGQMGLAASFIIIGVSVFFLWWSARAAWKGVLS